MVLVSIDTILSRNTHESDKFIYVDSSYNSLDNFKQKYSDPVIVKEFRDSLIDEDTQRIQNAFIKYDKQTIQDRIVREPLYNHEKVDKRPDYCKKETCELTDEEKISVEAYKQKHQYQERTGFVTNIAKCPFLAVVDIDIDKKLEDSAKKQIREEIVKKIQDSNLNVGLVQTAHGGVHIYCNTGRIHLNNNSMVKVISTEKYDVDVFACAYPDNELPSWDMLRMKYDDKVDPNDKDKIRKLRNIVVQQQSNITNVKDITGDFNETAIEGMVLDICNEVQNYDDQDVHTSRIMKSIIMDGRLNVGQKFAPKRWVDNMVNVIFLSNNAKPAKIEQHDRRYLALYAQDEMKNNKELFKRLYRNFNENFYRNLITFFYQVNLTDVNLTDNIPMTETKLDIQCASRTAVEDFIIQHLQSLKEGMLCSTAQVNCPSEMKLKNFQTAIKFYCERKVLMKQGQRQWYYILKPIHYDTYQKLSENLVDNDINE
ncbi:MAG: hypothetical protein EZS28_028897 [Streblomastix strix]|uniref:NrS-1 polymerase-like helicase domain-containing protein n=1 Tax=Streblomastix strix TaxID=222440 RepID=A0A5J4V0L2_9EUKA|nr:MAG: hypothetical protein EZS28_028897 [Streblomastix strix]